MVADLKPAAQGQLSFMPSHCARLVVKIGSSLLIGKDSHPRRAWLQSLVAELAVRHAAGQEIIIVSSGAIALGARRLGLDRGGRGSLADAQAAASVGQIALSGLWAELLEAQGIVAAQMLLTLEDLEDRRRYLNVTATLERLLHARAIPVINENDSVATEEIRFGDNDRLAARVAQAAGAGGVVLLSDVDGLYDRNPVDPSAKLVAEVLRITPEIRAMADSGSASGMGSGGMASKLIAAEIATMAGIRLAIVNGTQDAPLARWQGGDRGTVFQPRSRVKARKGWLGGRLRMKGVLLVDAGAARALRGGASLLAAGITRIEGAFERGDPVAIHDPQGLLIGRGLSEYAADDCARILGASSSSHAALLGYAPRSAVIHRDQLVLL